MTQLNLKTRTYRDNVVTHHVFENCLMCEGHGGYIEDNDSGECVDCEACMLVGKCPNCMHDGYNADQRCQGCTYLMGEGGPFLPIVFDVRAGASQIVIDQQREVLKRDYLKQAGKLKYLK